MLFINFVAVMFFHSTEICHQFTVMRVMMAMKDLLVYEYKRGDVCALLEFNNVFYMNLSRLARAGQLIAMYFLIIPAAAEFTRTV